MDQNQQTVKLGYFLDILSRRRWYIIIPFCVVMVIGVTLAIKLPRIYTAETVLFFQPPEVPEDYVPSIHQTLIESKLDEIKRQVTSRENLIKIIHEFFKRPEYGNVEIDINNMIDALRGRVWIGLIREDQTPTTFSISYEGAKHEDPETVMKVANTLATLFIEESLQNREEMAIDTSVFLEEEIMVKRKQLEAFDQKIKDFREKNMGGLPEQLGSNMRIIDRLESQHDRKQEHLLDAKNRLILLNDQLSEIQALQQDIYTANAGDDFEMNPFTKLIKMKMQLEDLQGRYTPQHPDIIILKQMIGDLEHQIKAGTVELPEALKHNFSMQQLDNINPLLAERRRSLLRQISAIKLEIEALKTESAEILNEIADHQKLVDETPLKEQELQILQRDYANVRNAYNSLLDRKMQAQLAISIEKKKKGEQFQVRRQAKLPHEPTEPNLKLIFLVTIFAAVHLGAGLVFLIEYFDSSVRHVTDLESDIGIPVLVTIPVLYTAGEKAKHRLNSVLTFASMAFAAAICAAFVVLVVNGLEGTMELIDEYIAHS
jgi:polysaccharide chain length determinant protein (PEP-CTERM system associated)